MEGESNDVVLAMEEPVRALDEETESLTQQLWEQLLPQLQAVLPHLNTGTLRDAFWQLARSMSHTHSLSYLEANEDVTSVVRQGEYARCFYAGGTLARYQSPCTFLVDARADFLYTHVIDQLLLLEYEGVEQQAHEAVARYERRARYYKPCPLEAEANHGAADRVCPLCWVVYTRVDSAFYKQVRARLVTSLTVDFSQTIYEYMDVEHLSFQLVLFLCGSQLVAEGEADAAVSHYTAVNQWVKVPIWWLLLH